MIRPARPTLTEVPLADLSFYPEHRDHDPEAGGGHGDTYPADVPYVITSQGSSGSDQVFMDAVAATIARFGLKPSGS